MKLLLPYKYILKYSTRLATIIILLTTFVEVIHIQIMIHLQKKRAAGVSRSLSNDEYRPCKFVELTDLTYLEEFIT